MLANVIFEYSVFLTTRTVVVDVGLTATSVDFAKQQAMRYYYISFSDVN